MPQIPGFCGPAYLSRSPNVAADRCINLYAERTEVPGGTPAYALSSVPGLRRYAVLPGPGGGRGLYTASGGRAFAVMGRTLYEVFAGGTSLERGTLASSTGHVSMADNGVDLVVVDGQPQGGWSLRLADNTWRAITHAGFYGATQVHFFDGFFVFNEPGTQQVYLSALYDAVTFDALDFASAEASPDLVVGHLVHRREWKIFGTRSGETWFNAGSPLFPFQPIAGTSGTDGLAAPFSLTACGESVYWLSRNAEGHGMVLRSQGYQAVRVSTHAIETAIQGYARLDDAVAYTEQRDGHLFYVLSFPTGNATWVYDAATGWWHQRAELDAATGALMRSRVQYHCVAFGLHLSLGDQDGRVYHSDPTFYANDTDPLVRERVAPHLRSTDRGLLYYSLVELDMQRGVGLDGGAEPGTTPQVMLRYSDDGGHTWSHERWVSAGAQGQYTWRAVWRRLGRSRDRVVCVRITDPVYVALIGARFSV